MLYVHTKDNGATAIGQPQVRGRDKLVARRRVHNARQLTLHEVAMTNLHAVQDQIRVHTPAANRTKILFIDHLAEIARVTDVLKDFSKPLVVPSSRRGGKADQVPRVFGGEKTEVVKD